MSFQMGLFPSYLSGDKGDQAPRLAAEINVKIVDRQTGDVFARKLRFDQHDVEAITEWMKLALTHEDVQVPALNFTGKRSTGR